MARERRDLTVPRGTPSTSAISASPSSANQRRPNGQAVVLAQPPDGGQQVRPPFAGQDRRLGRWGRSVRGAVLRNPQGQAGATARPAASIAGSVDHDPHQPRPWLGPAPEAPQRLPGADEALLGGVARLVGVTAHEERGTKRLLLVAAHKLLVGGHLSGPCPLHEFAIGQWTALHLSRCLHPPAGRGSRRQVSWSPMAPVTRLITGSGRLLTPEPYDGPLPWAIAVERRTCDWVGRTGRARRPRTTCWTWVLRWSRPAWWTHIPTRSSPATARTRLRPGWPASRTRAAASCARWRPPAPRRTTSWRRWSSGRLTASAARRHHHGRGQVRLWPFHRRRSCATCGSSVAWPAGCRYASSRPSLAPMPGRLIVPDYVDEVVDSHAPGSRRPRAWPSSATSSATTGFFTVEEAERILEPPRLMAAGLAAPPRRPAAAIGASRPGGAARGDQRRPPRAAG